MAILKLNISEMHCSACSATIEKNLSKNPFIKNIKINAVSGRGKIAYDENNITAQNIIDAITSYGFPASLDENKALEEVYIKSLKQKIFVALPLFFIIFILHMGGFHTQWSGALELILASIVQFYCGLPFYRGAKSIFKTKSADMNVLIALGTSVAYFYSVYLFFSGEMRFYFEGSSAIICFVLVGEYLKARAKKRANDELALLANLLPKEARILKDLCDKNPQWMAINSIKKDMLCLVVSGEKIPLDGIVVSGCAEISSAHINGEEMPKFAEKGAEIIGGSLLLNGEIIIQATKDADSFFVYEMLDLLEIAQEEKPPIGALADKIARIFVPSVIMLSILAFIIWLLVGKGLAFALSIAACVLVISCPCALGLAVPLAIVCASIRAKKDEILVKSPHIYEKAEQIKTIVFDKTGTLTKGEIIVKACEFLTNNKNFALSLAKSMQNHNPHPIAKAIMAFAKDADFIPLESKEYIIAKGVVADFKAARYYLGALEWIESMANVKTKTKVKESAIALAKEGEVLAIFYLEDAIKDNAKITIQALKARGITPVILSGDSKESVEKLAQSLEIESYFAAFNPMQKAQKIAALAKEGEVCFVGDGINDALALKEASFGISFAHATELAKEVGDVLLLKNDLWGIVLVFDLSRTTLQNIRQNLFFAYVYNIVLIPIAAGVLYPFFGIVLQPAYAGAAMALSSLSVVGNALRISRIKLKDKNCG